MRCSDCGKQSSLCECCPWWNRCKGWRQLAPGHWRRCHLVHPKPPSEVLQTLSSDGRNIVYWFDGKGLIYV